MFPTIREDFGETKSQIFKRQASIVDPRRIRNTIIYLYTNWKWTQERESVFFSLQREHIHWNDNEEN